MVVNSQDKPRYSGSRFHIFEHLWYSLSLLSIHRAPAPVLGIMKMNIGTTNWWRMITKLEIKYWNIWIYLQQKTEIMRLSCMLILYVYVWMECKISRRQLMKLRSIAGCTLWEENILKCCFGNKDSNARQLVVMVLINSGIKTE